MAIVGPSGSGKTTFLNLIAGILVPDQGEIAVRSESISSMTDSQRRRFRAENIGLVFQAFELIDYLNVQQNILLPLRLANSTIQPEHLTRTKALVTATGIDDKLHRFPSHLSQGEQQRVAICRALLLQPGLILADEPTGNLDPANKVKVVELLIQEARKIGSALIMVTHDQNLISNFDRVIDFETFAGLADAAEVAV